ncbi:hypothetical protein EZV61_09720 [Corallincola luteus]|uniref:Photosynthesis system II assembly factor Ycf48/Hcf136-like domain-containing protein n=2 Tax=Corallincola TaxID=1775176 RepID=A0A368NQ42_9GAMM|nr:MULTISPECIES: YCF48-related protein [Corallincola]RCU52662.1 hypothetical protein DU002_01445 [Corallincola holothuriorum]TCI03160.1 hypothetical protein EZV61_09720 [Corallincola luteus]
MGRIASFWVSLIGASALFSASSIAGSDSKALMVPNVTKALTLDFFSAQKQHYAVGERGHILKSDDGVNWIQLEVPIKTTLTRSFFVDDGQGWVVGHEASVLHTIDGGESWEIQHAWLKEDRPLLDLVFLTEQHGIAVGAYGLYLETTDGGNNWHQRFLTELLHEEDREYLTEIRLEDEQAYLEELNSLLPHFNAITRVGERLVMVGEMGLVAASDDNGASWHSLEASYEGSFFSVLALNNHDFMVAGLRGTVLRYQAGMWSNISLDQPITINNMVNSETGVWALGNGGHYYIVDGDSGRNQHFQLSTTPALLDVLFSGTVPVMASADGILIEPQLKAAN